VYLDLADEQWRAVEVTSSGWSVVSDPPVWFRRPGGMLSLPMPERGGDLIELRPFVNISEEDWPLLLASVVGAMRPRGPYQVSAFHGEQGSAKSTTARVIRSLIDPNKAALRAEPRSPHELAIAAGNAWLLVYDNLSYLRDWLSDGFCRLATGDGFAARELYTDTDEIIFDAQRPVILTGIGELATRSDLLDRSLILTLPRISDDRRRDEESFWHEFGEVRPRLLGALLDALSVALRRLADVQLEQQPRMADFARFAVAAEPALGLPEGTFLAAYEGKRAEAQATTSKRSRGSCRRRTCLASWRSMRPASGSANSRLRGLATLMRRGGRGWSERPCRRRAGRGGSSSSGPVRGCGRTAPGPRGPRSGGAALRRRLR
jgi:hypothetical protein